MKIQRHNGYDVVLSSDCSIKDCVLALGIFDGVHVAHRALLKRACELRQALGASAVGAWCFKSTGQTPAISSVEERVSLLLDSGMDFVVLADFDTFRNMSAERFVSEHLTATMECVGVVCGFNFRFGKDRLGSPDDIVSRLGQDRVSVVGEIKLNGVTVSSSEIRRLISNGEMENAAELLGRGFSLCTTVEGGKRLGRTIGFPTANQSFANGCIVPRRGIYASVCTTPDGRHYIGVSNIGVRPTIKDGTDSHLLNCETYIVGYKGDLYGQTLCVELVKYLRDECIFASVDELKQAISKDVRAAIDYFEEAADRYEI